MAAQPIIASSPKPIPTRYGGCFFRSRLEARWAVLFDYLGLRWLYEYEGFELGALGRYLPDFWFPDLTCWGEVKPKTFTRPEFNKASSLVPKGCILLDDQPSDRFWFLTCSNADWKEYLGATDFGRVHLEYSTRRKRLWFCMGERLEDYGVGATPGAIEAARSARFNGYPMPGEEPFNLTDREMREERANK